MMATARDAGSAALQRAWLTRGPLACALWPLALIHRLGLGLRRWAYAHGWRRSQRLAVPVIVVGNLVAGGAGKTPTTLALITLLRRHRYTPGIISRGHGRQRMDDIVDVRADTPVERCGDEPLLLRLRSGAPVVVGRHRAAAGTELLRRHPQVDVIVADDGLQHLALDRDVQVLVFDERGAGNGWLLPAGPLREPLPATTPAATMVLYNAARPSTPLPGALARRTLAGVVLLRDWWRGTAASPAALRALRGRPLVAAAGLARPGRFFAMLRDQGLQITSLPLPDHHRYADLPWPATAADVVVSEKDAVKLDPARMGATRVWVAALDFGFDDGFETSLLALLPLGHPPH